MKTKEELNALKEEIEALNKKLAELTGDELKEVSGGGHNYWGPLSGIVGDTGPDNGIISGQCPFCGDYQYFHTIGDYYDRRFCNCEKCGDMTYLKNEKRWEHGIIRR